MNFTVEKFKRIDVVVNSAGISRYERTISSKGVLSSESVEKIFKVNVIGTLNVCKHAAKQMSQQ